jgi:D-alanine-D-alanine ligase
MAEPEPLRARTLAIVTGDHELPDPTKLGVAYGPEDLACHAAMVEAIEGLGRFEVSVHTVHRSLFDELTQAAPDLVVNFCDTGIGNVPTRELHLPAWLELSGIAYTGATPQAMIVCFDKQIVRLVAQSLGVEVVEEIYLPAHLGFETLPDLYPALIKPNAADGSVGITKDAVVRNRSEAQRYLDFLCDELPGRDVLWQEYLPGPEYDIGLIGNPQHELVALPALEVNFSRLPPDCNPILSFESKADPSSPYWTEITFQQASLAPGDATRIQDWARALFRRFGLRDYGRFDFRCASDGRPKLMEVNPNPAWGNDGKLAHMAGFADISYARMLEMIIDAALFRLGQ